MVSAIITTFQRDIDIIDRSVNSIQNQTYKDIEIIIVDDNDFNSNYSIILKKYCKEKNIKYCSQNKNMGACSARNYGILNSSGDYIAFLDDDDEWMPGKIEKQVNIIEKDSDVGVVFCTGIIKFFDGNIQDYYNKSDFKESVQFQDLLYKDYVGSTSHPLIRKECFEKVGGFWIDQPARQDYEMWIRISQYYKIVGIKEDLFYHYIHEGEQISKNTVKSFNGYENIYKRYRKYYKNNSKADKQMINCLYALSKKKFLIKNLYYGFKKFIYMIKEN